MITIEELRVDYDSVTAVAEVNLAVNAGEICGLVGPNGAGKTSLIKAVAGLIEPTGGKVIMAGADMAVNPRDGWQHMGYMPDFSSVYEDLKVWEYLEVFAVAYKIPSEERMTRIKYWVERLNLEQKWDEFIRNLSRGMRQRLVLAKTLLHDPDILLLDEPASGMDPLARIDLRDILKERAKSGAAILISSHILSDMDELCTNLAVMEKGMFLVSGSLDEIRQARQSRSMIQIHLLPPVDTALAALKSQDKVQNLQEEEPPGMYSFDFSGNVEEAADLLNHLYEAGGRIAHFARQQEDMEALFMKIGGRETS